MAKFSKGVAFILAALLLISSCSLEDFMRGMGSNVLGGVGGDEAIDGITDIIDRGFTSDDPESDPYKELVNLVVQASKNPDTEKKLVQALSVNASDDNKTAMKPVLDDIEADIVESTGSASVEDFLTKALESATDPSNTDLPEAVKKEAEKAIEVAQNIIADIRGTGEGHETTKGDIAIINSALSIVETVMNEMENTGESGPSDEQISSLISTANEALKMFNTIKGATAFKDVNLNTVLDSFIASMGSGTESTPEGGEAV